MMVLGALPLGPILWRLAGAPLPPQWVGRAAGLYYAHILWFLLIPLWSAAGWSPRLGGFLLLSAAAIAVRVAVGEGGAAWVGLAPLLIPVALLFLSPRSARSQLGLGSSAPARDALIGLGAALLLGGHLFFSSSFSLGHRPRLLPLASVFSWIAFDAGLTALGGEVFFRGFLYGRLKALGWGFWPAASGSAAAFVLRLIFDPGIEKRWEVLLGTAVYAGLLGIVFAGLYQWRRSLIPSYLASLGFLTIYRAVAARP